MRPASIVFCAIAAAAPAPVAAQQPYSESLVDCAAIFTTTNRRFPERAEGEKGRRLQAVGDKLIVAALDQAKKEGVSDPGAHVNELYAAKSAKWDDRSLMFIFSEEFRDWASYCRKFTAHLGIDLPKE